MEERIVEVNKILEKYNLSKNDKLSFWDIIYPIFIHDEFQRRMNSTDYPHHGNTSLGNHIVNDAIVSFILAKKLCDRNIDVNQELSTIIAMFHDLYEFPWQNANRQENMFVNKHGFTHPLEAAINASTWYHEYFEEENKAKIIIDGIIHHMFPFPVRSLDDTDAELNNIEKFKYLEDDIQQLIINSSMRSKIGHVSICPSKYIEGNVVSTADKIVSLKKDNMGLNSYKALITGKNPDLDNYKSKK